MAKRVSLAGSLFLLFALFPILSQGQITVSATGGAPTGSYGSLKACFDAINIGTHQGVIDISVNASTVESNTAILNASGGASSYIAVTIMPTVVCSVSGNVHGPLIELSGADSVTIDGRIGGVGTARSLTISNSNNTASFPLSYAIKAHTNADGNTVRYTVLESLGQSIFLYNNASIYTDGLRNNIAWNEIRGVPGGWQSFGIETYGDFTTVTHNEVHEFASAQLWSNSAGLWVDGNNSLISANSVYQSDTVSSSSNFGQSYILAMGQDVTITGNFIGGSAPFTAGNPAVYSGRYGVNGITVQLNSSGTIDSNIITNFRFLPSTSFTGLQGMWVSGNFDIGVIEGNIIGSMTDTGVIRADYGFSTGILVSGSIAQTRMNIQNNKIGGLSSEYDSPAGLANFNSYGIGAFQVDSIIISNNIIGNLLNDNMKMSGVDCGLAGIGVFYNEDQSYSLVSDNTIQNLSNVSSGQSKTCGIYSGLTNNNITEERNIIGNAIHHLSSSNGGQAILDGIYAGMFAPATNTFMKSRINGNYISDLSLSATGSDAALSGIRYEAPFTGYAHLDSNQINGLAGTVPNTTVNGLLAVQGVGFFATTNAPVTVSENSISVLTNNAGAATVAAGINTLYLGNNNMFTIASNRIWGIDNVGPAGAAANGIMFRGAGFLGSYSIQNNMVSLKAADAEVNGIYNVQSADSADIYYNSVYVGGVSAGSNSAAFRRPAGVNTDLRIKDNIFQNERTGTGNHYALQAAGANPGVGIFYANYNNYYSTAATNTVLWGNTAHDLAGYQAASNLDGCSRNIQASFIEPDTADLHLTMGAGNNSLIGEVIANIAVDYDGNARNNPPTIGADELAQALLAVVIANTGSNNICSGDTSVLVSNPQIAVQWYRNWQLIAGGANDSMYASQPGTYIAVYTNGCFADTSNSITIGTGMVYDTISATICLGQVYQFGSQVLSATGVYQEVFVTGGCDSSVSLTLSVTGSNDTIAATICNGDVYVFGGQSLSQAGFYPDTLIGVNNCDTIVNLVLMVSGSNDTTEATICNGSVYLFGGQLLSQPGFYTDSLINATNCDSVKHLVLSVSGSTDTITAAICDGDSYQFGGQVITTDGMYTDSLINVAGCDSIIVLQLSVITVPDSIYAYAGALVVADSGIASFQWINCDNGFQPIAGATNGEFIPWAYGVYAVIASVGNCTDTSFCLDVTTINDLAANLQVFISPNPGTEQCLITAGFSMNGASVSITDLSGRNMMKGKDITNESLLLDTRQLPVGVYIIEVRKGGDVLRRKWVKE